jgi:hypothetical protein
MRILILLATLISLSATASEQWMNFHIASLHSESTVEIDHTPYKVNEMNIGFGYEDALNSSNAMRPYSSYRFGIFYNTYRQLSVYAVLDAHTKNTNGFGAGLLMGAVTGYREATDRNLTPGVVPYLKYIYDDYKAELSFNYGAETSAIGFSVGVAY